MAKLTEENIKQFLEKHSTTGEVIEKLAEYERLEEQGLLLRLPCKVGDTVFDVDEMLEIVMECKVDKFATDEAGVLYVKYHSVDFDAKMYLERFGDTLFLNREQAEQKLAEMKGE